MKGMLKEAFKPKLKVMIAIKAGRPMGMEDHEDEMEDSMENKMKSKINFKKTKLTPVKIASAGKRLKLAKAVSGVKK